MNYRTTLVILFIVSFFSLLSASTPQREFRATWVATVSNIDWPRTKITSGTTAQINAQKNELITILDSLQSANMNAVFLQIRPMADALYITNITTWSSYLTGTRGKNPGYDPLKFAIEEAHKRGLELHGWMNPYRYTNSSTTHSAQDYLMLQHPDWLLNFSTGEKILNPGIPAVRTHIAQVTKEVIINYPTIDGIVWDDYFYIEIIGTGNQDENTYQNFNPNGLSIKDWRRDNVNKTVKEVYDSIQIINPGIRFGISPRGIWGIKQSDANQYGVTLPAGITGADNYNGIYCDGLAWLSQGTIDYISPQLYWATYPTGGKGQDYNQLAPWWQSVANKYGRHFYSSQGLYRGFENDEIGRQMDKNREINTVSPGSVFYNTTYFLNKGFNYNGFLLKNYFQNYILPPEITWKNAPLFPVSNVRVEGDDLKWDCEQTDGSFAIFAVPKNMSFQPIFMITRCWTNENKFSILKYSHLKETYNFGVASVNRMEKMSEVSFQSSNTEIPNHSVSNNLNVSIVHSELHITVEKPVQVVVFAVNGLIIFDEMVRNELSLMLPKGIYFIKTNNETKKIVL